MSAIFWILVGGITGWLTGTFMEEQGYGKRLLGGYARSLDIVLGIVGASFGGYLFFWAVIGEGSSFSRYATAILGSAALVGVVRLISARNLAWVTNNRFIVLKKWRGQKVLRSP
ncbi:MAG TPA: GlsB/YeaQ/YmgE family stress response membrane protein [Candidatus Binatia bacterium]|nr:GlsB/YeaQ/YmgE family stress response membrane protein [Candidatus Binatia bacterium]